MAAGAPAVARTVGASGLRIDRLVKVAGWYVLVTALTVSFLVPTLWLVSSSFKASTEIFVHPIKWIPDRLLWENYVEAFRVQPLGRFALNTGIVVLFAVLGTAAASAAVAFSFARLRWPGRDPFVLLLRHFYRGLPYELDEAARIDGAGSFRILTQILIPLSKPALTTVVIFSILANYNDFLHPLIYLNRQETWTLALGIRAFNDSYVARWELIFAAATSMLVPMAVLFFAAQRYFVQGIQLTGMGGR
jgi:ABC-type glycerol-3-phosphate transport system permease component